MALVLGLAGLAFGPTRAVLDRVLPKPGEGPSEEAQDEGPVPHGGHRGGDQRRALPHHGAAPYDPGYSGTAVMLGQAALSLVEDGDRLPDAAGVLTPATALGAPLVDRLRAHRFTLETERLPG